MTRLLSTGFLLFTLTLSPSASFAQLSAVRMASGFTMPVAMVAVPGMTSTFFVVEQGGRIRVVQNGTVLPTDFLNLTGITVASGEQGLLGLALAPDYISSGRFWVNFTDTSGNTVVARFKRSASNALVADMSTRFDLVWPDGHAFITQPFANHNGGNLMFGPDGFMYMGMGDGGSGDDPFNNAQNPMSLLGKMLRIDVNVPDTDPRGYKIPATNPFLGMPAYFPEIWDIGMRNPWRWSFDDPNRGGTGALVIGDVGQNLFEEVDYEPAGQGGKNYGWRVREGFHDHILSPPPTFLPLTDPIWEYTHADGQNITGGYVYRGSVLTGYQGRYFFADFGFSRVWSIALTINPVTHEAVASDLIEHTATLGAGAGVVSSFAVDLNGELYTLNYSTGEVYQITLAPGAVPPAPPPAFSGCTTPDPFTALGGGTCVNGGWFPPNEAPPPAPSPSPTPTPAPTLGGCTTPNPFSNFGAGVCVNGGWQFGTPPAPPAPTPTPTPTPTPAPTQTGCATPDPFVAFGGGTCANGGWFPPAAGTPPPAPTPPAPPPAPGPGGCTTPDPFVGIPGLHGVCFNGGWYPSGS
jgi:glucose/arabinose dehydrogenase